MLPEFKTERLLLRPRTMADLASCLAMDRDPEVTKFVPGPWNDPDAHLRFVTERIQTDFGTNLGYWSLFAKDESELFLGWVLLIPSDGIGPEIEIGWRLNRHAWGKGIASEAARPLVGHAFATVGLDRFVANIHAGNAASIRVAEKIGMRFAGDGLYDGLPCKNYVITRYEARGSL
jgi:RimJ/RimL family protein N-acetyltransferase